MDETIIILFKHTSTRTKSVWLLLQLTVSLLKHWSFIWHKFCFSDLVIKDYMWVTSRQNDPIRTILTHRLKVCRNDVKLSIDWHSLWKVLFLWILWETVSILHEMDQFQVGSIYLLYKSTCLIHDYCNVLLNNLKWSQSVVVCERSVAHIVSVSISVYPFLKLTNVKYLNRLWFM